MDLNQKINTINWDGITQNINERSYAHTLKVIPDDACEELISQYNNETLYRKTINMERYRFRLGEYKYYNYPLPVLVQQLRGIAYPHLAPIANKWMQAVNIDKHFP